MNQATKAAELIARDPAGPAVPGAAHPTHAAAEWVLRSSLTPFAGNPRRNDATIPVVADSIRRFGFGAPMVARLADKMILAGHARLGAAELLAAQWETATSRERATWHPDAVRVATKGEVVVRFVDLDAHDSKLYVVADNRIGEELSTTDDDKLAAILAELRAEEVDLLDGTGLTDAAIRDLLDDALPGGGDGDLGGLDRPSELQARWNTAVGQIWQIESKAVPGRGHRLAVGDSRDRGLYSG